MTRPKPLYAFGTPTANQHDLSESANHQGKQHGWVAAHIPREHVALIRDARLERQTTDVFHRENLDRVAVKHRMLRLHNLTLHERTLRREPRRWRLVRRTGPPADVRQARPPQVGVARELLLCSATTPQVSRAASCSSTRAKFIVQFSGRGVSISEVLATVNQMQLDGIIEKYAIGGAVEATFYLEPMSTFDGGIFVAFQAELRKLILSMQPIFDYLTARWGVVEGEYVVVGGWPNQ